MVIGLRNSVFDRRKASQKDQHDHLTNTEALYIYIFYFFS